jgi:glycosyltransferase involved in cell wall biosynthesis
MSAYKPYRCTHLNLAVQNAWEEPVNHHQGYYAVLWWNEIPVGHLFIKPGTALTPALFERNVTHAASWALRHYTQSLSVPVNSLDELRKCFEKSLPVSESIPEVCNVSVVICTKDRADSLRKCLESLMALRCRPSEIIVVDNATVNDSTRKTAEAFAGVKYVREERVGLDIARNTGAKAATAPIVLYTDDDTIIHPLWVYQACKTFEDPSVAAMTGLVLAAELRTEAQWIFERCWPFNRGFVDRRYDREFFNTTLPKGAPVWTIGAGANMAFRKSIFEKAGYFDERLDVGAAGCNGDSEMWYRVLAAGHTIHYNPRAVVSHYHREDMDKFRRQIFYYMRGFTTAILIQYQRFGHKGNLKHLFGSLLSYYAWLLFRGFPFYKNRYQTIFSELKGILSGLFFYLKNRNVPSNISDQQIRSRMVKSEIRSGS